MSGSMTVHLWTCFYIRVVMVMGTSKFVVISVQSSVVHVAFILSAFALECLFTPFEYAVNPILVGALVIPAINMVKIATRKYKKKLP